MAISKKIRFEIFKRDGFVCKYCGKYPPEITLEVDHIIPIAEKGTDDVNNLITSCFSCNRGKSKTPLDRLPSTITENLEVIKEQQKQTKQYYKFLEKNEQQQEDNIRDVGHHFFNIFTKNEEEKNSYVFGGNWKTSIKIFFKTFNKFEIIEAIDIALLRLSQRRGNLNQDALFKYMCGILHNWRRDRQ